MERGDEGKTDHVETGTNSRDAREFSGAARGPDLKEAIRRDPEKANRLAAGLAAWTKGK